MLRDIASFVSLFVHSNENIIGCIFAFGGLSLYYFNIVSENWLLIVALLYALGYRIAPPPPKIVINYDGLMSKSELIVALNRTVKKVKVHIPPEMLSAVLQIQNELIQIIRRYDDLNHDIQQKHIIQQTVVDYLPTILETYLRIPKVYRKLYNSNAENSPLKVAISQLDILQAQTSKTIHYISDKNTSALKAHAKFLELKFAQSSNR